ncbi:MAG: hypothetical protein HeimC3_35110 [Candidatus Heimdallarchaeota archaeon LC_3]|nr:MAG: hypothetical protein HeimC3_35110 [Candidatus Heimdallarchaeota archaeon LC_3]
MDNPLYFIYGSPIKERILRLIIVIFSFINFSLFLIDFLTYYYFFSGLIAIIMFFFIIFFFPRISYISIVHIKNGFITTNRWYTNKRVQKIIGKMNFSRSFQLLNLDRVEIQYLGFISKIGRINFIFTDKKQEKILFSPIHISSDHINNMKGFFGNLKFIDTETVNNLVILSEHFSYDFDATEFYQFDNKYYLYLVILVFLLFLPITLLLIFF